MDTLTEQIEASYDKREFVKGSRKWLKHVRCAWARFHVVYWSGGPGGAREHCSEPDCVINRPIK